MSRILLMGIILMLCGASAAWAGEIHTAAAAGDLARVTELLAESPELAQATNENATMDFALHSAAIAGHIEVAKLLLEHGTPVDCGDSDLSTPLHVAALRNQPEMVAFLLSHGADANFQDNNGAWSVSFAASARNLDIVKQLVAAGARLDLTTANGITMAHYAARLGEPELLDMALKAGVDPQSRSEHGESVLHYAATGGQVEMIKTLIAEGADPDIRDSNGSTPLLASAWRSQTEAIACLIDLGADINAIDDSGRGALCTAADDEEPTLAMLLIERGADVNLCTEFGETPLIRAAGGGRVDIVKALIAAGAQIGSREAHGGCTALHAAAIRGYEDVATALVPGCKNLNSRNADGETAWDLAMKYGHKKVAGYLLAQGSRQADPPPACPAETGCLAACPESKTEGALAQGESKTWYLGHSGFAVQTRNNLMIFDFWSRGRQADEPALCNGWINPEEIGDRDVTVFVSHAHGDHFDPAIFEWAATKPDIRYLMGCEAETDQAYELLQPRQTKKYGSMTVHTIDSNDSGLGFLVEADGVVIYHPGDHANRQRDFSGPFCAEIDYLAATGLRPDIAMMPISGCGFGDLEAVRLGTMYTLEKLQPKVFLPAHSLGAEYRYEEFIDQCRYDFPQVKMIAPKHKGDHFTSVKGDAS
jgi:uncharacterized protein